jgi:hypothetical protein
VLKIMHRPAALAALLAALLCLSGCGASTTSAGTTSGTSSAPTSSAPTSTGPVPLAAADVAWLAKLATLPPQLDKALDTSSDPNLSVKRMAAMAGTLRGCRRGLARFGRPSTRLANVLDIAQQACARYDAAAACFATAAGVGIPFQGSSAERKQTKAIQCGFDQAAEGGPLLASALTLGEEIKAGTA